MQIYNLILFRISTVFEYNSFLVPTTEYQKLVDSDLGSVQLEIYSVILVSSYIFFYHI